MTQQSEQYERYLKQLLEQQKENMKTLEMRFLDAKHELRRSKHLPLGSAIVSCL